MDKVLRQTLVFVSNRALREKVFSGNFFYFSGGFWEEDWALGHNSMKFWDFADIPNFPRFVWQLVRQLEHTMFITNNIASFHLCQTQKIWSNIKKSQKIVTTIVCEIFFCFLCLFNSSSCWNSHSLTRIYFLFLKSIPRPKLKALNTKFVLSEKIWKVVVKQEKF